MEYATFKAPHFCTFPLKHKQEICLIVLPFLEKICCWVGFQSFDQCYHSSTSLLIKINMGTSLKMGTSLIENEIFLLCFLKRWENKVIYENIYIATYPSSILWPDFATSWIEHIKILKSDVRIGRINFDQNLGTTFFLILLPFSVFSSWVRYFVSMLHDFDVLCCLSCTLSLIYDLSTHDAVYHSLPIILLNQSWSCWKWLLVFVLAWIPSWKRYLR